MSYLDLYDELLKILAETEANIASLTTKVGNREWDRSQAYINAVRAQMMSVKALVMVLAEIDRTRPPTDASGFILPRQPDD